MSKTRLVGGFFTGDSRGRINLPPKSAQEYEIPNGIEDFKGTGYLEISYRDENERV